MQPTLTFLPLHHTRHELTDESGWYDMDGAARAVTLRNLTGVDILFSLSDVQLGQRGPQVSLLRGGCAVLFGTRDPGLPPQDFQRTGTLHPHELLMAGNSNPLRGDLAPTGSGFFVGPEALPLLECVRLKAKSVAGNGLLEVTYGRLIAAYQFPAA